MANTEFTVTKRQAAFMMDVDERNLARYSSYIEDPLPIREVGGGGKGHKYCPRQVMLWYARQEVKKLRTDKEGNVYDIEAERARLTYHQANKAAMDEDVQSGDLIPSGKVKSAWASLVISFRAKMIGIPNKAAPQIMGVEDLRETESILQDMIYDALSELADPDAPEDLVGSDEDGETTSAVERKSVG